MVFNLPGKIKLYHGTIRNKNEDYAVVAVRELGRSFALHHDVLRGGYNEGDSLELVVDRTNRGSGLQNQLYMGSVGRVVILHNMSSIAVSNGINLYTAGPVDDDVLRERDAVIKGQYDIYDIDFDGGSFVPVQRVA